MKSLIAVFGLAVAFSVGTASAQWTFQATLSGLGENPVNASPGTGFGTVVLNAAQTQITVNESWSGLSARRQPRISTGRVELAPMLRYCFHLAESRQRQRLNSRADICDHSATSELLVRRIIVHERAYFDFPGW